MLTLVMEARLIPNDTFVRKITGEKEYLIRDTIVIHGMDEKVYTPDKGLKILMANFQCNIIPGDTKLAIDFKNVDELENFIFQHLKD